MLYIARPPCDYHSCRSSAAEGRTARRWQAIPKHWTHPGQDPAAVDDKDVSGELELGDDNRLKLKLGWLKVDNDLRDLDWDSLSSSL